MSDRESSGADEPDPDERAARLAALLAVDVGDTRPSWPDDRDRERTGGRTPRRRLRRRAGWHPVVSGGVLVALMLVGAGLAYAGSRIVRSSTEGRVITPIDDPAAPGFEALVDATPTILLMHDAGGLIDAMTVLSLPDPDHGGGGVLFVPTRTVAEMPVFDVDPIETAYDLASPELQTEVVGNLLGAAMQESTIVDADRWASLVAPVAPITIDNPNELAVDGEVRFPLGEIELEADEVGPYLEARVEGESDLARLFRHELFWRAWLAAVAEAGSDAAVPGELEVGLGRFVRQLASGERLVETLPVVPAAEGRYGEEPAFVPRFEHVDQLVQRLVPLPVSPSPGARARVRVLNGTPDTTEAASVAATLPPAGVEVVLVGNALSLDVAETTVRYFGEEFRDEAEAVVEILGVGGVVEETRPSDLADITVTLGADHV